MIDVDTVLISAPFSWYETPDDVQRRLSSVWRARPDKRVLSRHVPKRHSRYMRSTLRSGRKSV